jgi:hypothetical protein
MILEPIDKAIVEYYKNIESNFNQREWDKPMRKVAYTYITYRYGKWFKKIKNEF